MDSPRLTTTLQEWNDKHDRIENSAMSCVEMLAVTRELIPEIDSTETLDKVMSDLRELHDRWWEHYASIEDFTTFEVVDLVIKGIQESHFLAELRSEQLQNQLD